MASSNKMDTWNNMKTPTITERMLDLYENSKWHDCVFKLTNSDGTGEELVYAHNLVLASCSPVFEALCFGPLAKCSPIELPDVDPLAFKVMLKFIYTDFIEFTSVETACNILYVSKKYLIYSLAALSISYISDHINEINCLQLYRFSLFIQEDCLVKKSWAYLCSHLDAASKYFSGESLNAEIVRNLVKEPALNGSELIVYKICIMWAEADCINNNLEVTDKNLRKVLIHADVLNKIRFLTFPLKDFKEGPQKRGILTDEELRVILNFIKLINDIHLDCGSTNESQDRSDYKLGLLKCSLGSEDNEIVNNIHEASREFPSSFCGITERRKKIQLKKYCCHRFIEKEVNLTVGLKDLKIRTYIKFDKTVWLTAVYLNAKVLPLAQLGNKYSHSYDVERDYTEKLCIAICDNYNKRFFTMSFCQKVILGTVFMIQFPKPIMIEGLEEYYIQIDLLNSPENYLYGVRNSTTKFPSGLCISFRDEANVGINGNFVETKYLSIFSGLSFHL